MYRPDYGYLEIIVGPMFSGKSSELIRRMHIERYAKKDIYLFKPSIDTRYDSKSIVSHDGQKEPAISIKNSSEILEYVFGKNNEFDKNNNNKVVGIDEVQFLDDGVIDVIDQLIDKGVNVIVSGLDLDFKSAPFYITSTLLAKAEFVTKLQAVCVKCQRPATRTQRIINGKIAKKDDPVVLIGEKESYEARCRKCHEID